MPPKNKFLQTKQSDVTAHDASGNVMKGFQVWVLAQEADGTIFKRALVLPGSTKDNYRVKLVDSEEEKEVKKSEVWNLNSNLDPFGFSDIGTLPHTNHAAVLDFLKQRLSGGQIYSTADPLLVALNPFKNLGNATNEIINQYRDCQDVTKLPPHVFTLARNALESLHMVRKSQTIIVSGESGAGKTEATKQVMRYFAAAKSGNIDLRIQTAVLAANPVLEAFGNAKTTRNNNSSRFGRFMMLKVAASGGIQYGTVRNFLLEKSRILTQESKERNYHIFYQLLKGADNDLRSKLGLKGLADYKFINPLCPDADGIDDVEEWNLVADSLESMGLTADEKFAVFSLVAGVMLMGNVKIIAAPADGVPDAATLDESSRDVYEAACKLMYLDPALTEQGFTIKISFAGGQEIRGRWALKDGKMLMESLCKAVYDKLFFWLVVKLNGNIEPPEPWTLFMGMLDIFGFEVFENNSLEQLFINITNEQLQKNFTDVVFEKETKLYRDEGISAADLKWTSNDEVIQALTAKKASVMAALDEACLAPSATDEGFLSTAYRMLKDSKKINRPKLQGNVKFVVEHTIGEIDYHVEGFLFKNKDVLRADLVEVVQASSNPVARALFEGVVVERGKMKGQYIGAQFMSQLEDLMNLINSTEPHFVRCVKPNEEKLPLVFNQAKVLVQLFSLSILEALQLRNLGFSYRRPFTEFLFQFRFIDLGVAEDDTKDPKDRAALLMKRTGINEGWQIGKTMIFLKPNVAKEMVNLQRRAMAAWEPQCAVIEALWLSKMLKRRVLLTECFFTRFQAHSRKKVAGKVAPPNFLQPVKSWGG